MENVNHPVHYTAAVHNFEPIVVMDYLPCSLGNAFKYAVRADYKNNRTEDLKKCIWYIDHYFNDTPPDAIKVTNKALPVLLSFICCCDVYRLKSIMSELELRKDVSIISFFSELHANIVEELKLLEK